MLKPIFIDNGLSYEDCAIETCLLIDETRIPEVMAHFEKVSNDNYNSRRGDSSCEFKHITEQSVFDYLDKNGIQFFELDPYDTLIRQE